MPKKLDRRQRIKFKIRKKISGTSEMPRLSLFRSNTAITAQLIDDISGKTLLAISSLKGETKGTKVEIAQELGKKFGNSLKEKGFEKIVFDRNGYLYHGRVKAFADGVREAGLSF